MFITANMSILEIVQVYPQTVDVFRNYGMGCFGCSAARFENIEQGASAHNIDIHALLADLNKAIDEKGCTFCD